MLDKLAYLTGSLVLSTIFTFITLFLIVFIVDLLDKKTNHFFDNFFD